MVTEISNESTGYCPDLDSWPAVAAVLDRAGICHPDGFTQPIIFRACTTFHRSTSSATMTSPAPCAAPPCPAGGTSTSFDSPRHRLQPVLGF
jgi:hypothetical protein